jgi:hypothetical protein
VKTPALFRPGLKNTGFKSCSGSAAIVANTTANMNYKLENICLEYNTITNETLARQIHFDYIDYFKETSIYANYTLINENVNFKKR